MQPSSDRPWHVHYPNGVASVLEIERATLPELLLRAVERSPDAPAALILAGDFNAPYATNHLHELRSAGLREAHHESGVGRGASWGPRRVPLSWAPGIRLDHVMFTGDAQCTASGVGGDIGSDHRPVWASLRIGSD